MFDLRLQENPHLLLLMEHYAQKGTYKHLSALHGELIVFDWIEQNTGQAIMLTDGRLSACYWITLHGLREFRRFHGVEIVEERAEAEKPRFPWKKKEKSEAPAVAASEESLVPPTAVGWQITEPQQAEDAIRDQHTDLVMLAREMLRDPYWPYHAAVKLGVDKAPEMLPIQYARAVKR